MDSIEPDESALIVTLKTLCDEKGFETNPKESGRILHKLGKIYCRKIPHMLNMIRSSALYVAAIVRNPTNVKEIKRDLNELCLSVLSKANCRDGNADLMKISREISHKVEILRAETASALVEFQHIHQGIAAADKLDLEKTKIANVRKLMSKIADEYTAIMRFTSQKVIEIMGDAPAKFAVVGLGSLAKMEITPYSDFEHVILLEDDVIDRPNRAEVIQFFEWFTVLFHIIVIGLEETILPCVGVPTLHNHSCVESWWFYDAITTRGIAFDGMLPHACKTPFGRRQETKNKPWKTELIKPVSEMLKYNETDMDLKNGYNLADVLARPCFVFGSKDVYFSYSLKVDELRRLNDIESNFKCLRNTLQRDLTNYCIKKLVKEAHTSGEYNIKQLAYQSMLLLISSLGRYYDVKTYSSFSILDALKQRCVIDEDTTHYLKYAVAIACEIRLKVYSDLRQQNNYVRSSPNAPFEKLVGAVGINS